MLLRVIHHTHYSYQTPVLLAHHLAHLHPLEHVGQKLLAHQIFIDPPPNQYQDDVDSFGNKRRFFALQTPHSQLSVTADSLLQTQAPTPLPDSPPWEEVQQSLRYHAHAPYQAAAEFTFASPYVPLSDAFADFARPVFTPKRPLLQACQALMALIYTELTYEPASTEVNTPALEALEQRKGVCQDFAHIMIGGLRALGLPARYVSGYLLTLPQAGQPRLIGADASHAWVSVCCQGVWYDFDPTNNRSGHPSPGEDYVTLAVGRDFGDVSPLRGVIQGGGSHTLTVGVTVVPADEYEGLARIQHTPNNPSI